MTQMQAADDTHCIMHTRRVNFLGMTSINSAILPRFVNCVRMDQAGLVLVLYTRKEGT